MIKSSGPLLARLPAPHCHGYDDTAMEDLLTTAQKIILYLEAEGFSLLGAGKSMGGWGQTTVVNRVIFTRGKEQVFINILKGQE
jgi:hypothetical protein